MVTLKQSEQEGIYRNLYHMNKISLASKNAGMDLFEGLL